MANVPPRNFKRLAGSERNQPANARQVGPVDPDELIEVSVYLRDPTTSSLAGDSSEYAQQPGQRITRAEYVANHSATPDDLAKVEAFAREHNLTIVETDLVGRKVVLAGTAAALMTCTFPANLSRSLWVFLDWMIDLKPNHICDTMILRQPSCERVQALLPTLYRALPIHHPNFPSSTTFRQVLMGGANV